MVPSLGAGAGAWCPAGSRLKRPGERVVRAEGVEPSRAEAQRIFIPSTAFAARTRRFEAHASGLRSGLSLHRPPKDPGLRCCPSSLYTFPERRSGLGSGLPFQVSPNLGSSASPVSQASTQVSLSPLRLPVPPHPHGRSCIAFIRGLRNVHLSLVSRFSEGCSSFLVLASAA